MSTDYGWYTAQMPRFVQATGLNASYTAPDKKAREAEELAREIEAFKAKGGKVETIHQPGRNAGKSAAAALGQKYVDARAKGRETQARNRRSGAAR